MNENELIKKPPSSYASLLQYFEREVNVLSDEFERAGVYQESLYQGILKLMYSFCPLKLLIPLLGRNGICNSRLHIRDLLFKEIAKYPELDFDMDTRFLAKLLARTQSPMETASITKEISFLSRGKGILSFILYFDGEYLEAFKGFRWCLQLFYYVEKYATGAENIRPLLRDYERIFSILCAKAVVKQIQKHGYFLVGDQCFPTKPSEVDILQGLLFTMLECTDPSMMASENPLESFVISKFFQLLGDIEYCISILNGTLAQYVYDDRPYSLALRLQRSNLNAMIRRYIFSTTTTIEDDPLIVYRSNKIIEGIVLYGGVHIDILRFFHAVKCFYKSSLRGSPALYSERDFTKESILMVDNIIEEWDLITSQCDPKTVQLPQVLLRTIEGSLVMVDEVFEESSNEHQHEITLLLSSFKLRAKRKLLGEPHTQSNYSISLRKLATEWVCLWKQLYLDSNDDIPTDLLQMALDIMDWPV